MKNKDISRHKSSVTSNKEGFDSFKKSEFPAIFSLNIAPDQSKAVVADPAEILFITSYPPRECGIATYSQDLIKALNNKFSDTFSIKVCALESGYANLKYPDEVIYTLKTSLVYDYWKLATLINENEKIKVVLIQHEFGFFKTQEKPFLEFLRALNKPLAIVFHTVLPSPDKQLKLKINNIAAVCDAIIVMTNNSAKILTNAYGLPKSKITVIAHGTHLVTHSGKEYLKKKYGVEGHKVLTTFGLLSSGKSIETTLRALPLIIQTNPEALFLIIGKTHPEVLKEEGEHYRQSLESIIEKSDLKSHVKFINTYLPLSELLEYLQLTDIYLFTTNDPNQAVSGTFSYAMSCGCPIISTPIPHAREVLTKDTGIIFDFGNSEQLAEAVVRLLNDSALRSSIRINTLQKIVSTSWENSAVEHAMLFEKIATEKINIVYNLPVINLDHIKRMTTDIGIIQFSKINQPDLCTGYTLDDNARAMIALVMHHAFTNEKKDITYIDIYLKFIKSCIQDDGSFLNYADSNNKFTRQNISENLDDANGRALWALGYLIAGNHSLPKTIVTEAVEIFKMALPHIATIHSTRAMSFAIKGLYHYYKATDSQESLKLLKILANRLVEMFKHESSERWQWFEGYLTYANSVLPEAMLYSWLTTGNTIYKEIAVASFDFLLSKTFNENGIEVISNRKWLKRGEASGHFGEQPIDVAYTVMALNNFYNAFSDKDYYSKMKIAFSWFLGKNRLHQIIYNPRTGGCYDGLEETHVNLNQGAESTISYLMARLTMELYQKPARKSSSPGLYYSENKLITAEAMSFSGPPTPVMPLSDYRASGYPRRETKRKRV